MYNINNFQQRISWLSQRWRTQRNAIRSVNCRIPWIIESLNAPCTLWYSEGYARLSVIVISLQRLFCCLNVDLDVAVLLRLVLNAWVYPVLQRIRCNKHFTRVGWKTAFVIWALCFEPSTCRQLFDNLTSNRVGLPAELKHINKRRKRN